MKILVVVDSIDVNDSSGSKANVALIHNLAACGFEVRVLHYTQKNIPLEGIQCISIQEKKWTLSYLLSRTERLFTRWTKINLNPALEGFFGFSFTFFNDSSSIAAAIDKQKDFHPDWVFTLSKGASFRPHYAMLKMSQLHGKWLAYVHDPYPFHYYPRPYNWIQPGYRQKEKFFAAVAEKAKYSVFPSLLLKEWMGSYFPRFLETGIIIPHQLAFYKDSEVQLPNYFNKDHFTILHAGNLMKQRDPRFLMEAFQSFLANTEGAYKDAQLVLIGSASYHKAWLERNIPKSKNVVVIYENKPFEEVLHMQKNAAVNVILESKSEISPFLPAKIPHCVLANKKLLVLGPYYSETRRLLGNDYEYWSEVDDSERIAHLITMLYGIWKKDKASLVLDRADLIAYLSADHLKKVLTEILY